MPVFQHAIGQGRARPVGGGSPLFRVQDEGGGRNDVRGAHEADRCKSAGRIAVRSDVAAATGPCGHGKVEISEPLRRYLPHEARPARLKIWSAVWEKSRFQSGPYHPLSPESR